MLTQRLLAFSRRQTLAPKSTNINKLITGFEDLVRRSIGPSVALHIRAADDLWLIRIDHSQLENALVNLCINARDAMPDGGTITVATSNRQLERADAKRLQLPGGQYVVISITDTGTGMTDDVIASAFNPFFTTKPMGQGPGLGLSMIQGLCSPVGRSGSHRIPRRPRHDSVSLLPRYAGSEDAADGLDHVQVAQNARMGKQFWSSMMRQQCGC
jgi:signal transduction histidine kinase